MTILEELQTSLDVNVRGVEVGSALVRVKRVGCLVVARLVQGSKIVPNLRDVGVEPDGARICVQCVTVLVDLVVQHTNAAPECRVAPVTVDRLLVSLVRLGVLLLRHIASTEEVPALCIGLI